MPSPQPREVANVNGRNSTGFFSATASVTIPAGAVEIGDLLIVSIAMDYSRNRANLSGLSGSGWTRFVNVDAGLEKPNIQAWWKWNTTTASQTYSITWSDGFQYAMVSYWQAWEGSSVHPTQPISGAVGHVNFGGKAPPYPSTASTLSPNPSATGDRVLQTVFSLQNGGNAPSWVNRPAPWVQTVNREDSNGLNSQFGAWRYATPGGSDIAMPAVDFPVSGTTVRPYVNATYYINPPPVVIDAREGQGYAKVGLKSGPSQGAKRSTAPVRAAVGLSGRGAGSKAGQGSSRAAVGHAGRGNGAKAGVGAGLTPAAGISSRSTGRKQGVGYGWSTKLGIGGYGMEPPPIPVFTGRPLPEDPLPLAQSRYLVQNILTGDFLHTDLPLADDQVTLTLSGPCEITGKITPEMADLKAPDGSPLLRSWGHVLHLELDGEIRASALITEDSYSDQTQTLTCQGISAYPSVIAYQGAYRRYFADPMTVVEQMWAYVQGFPNGNLGVAVERMGGVPSVLYGAKVNPVPGDKLLGYDYAKRPENDTDEDPPTLPVARKNTLAGVWNALIAKGYKPQPFTAEDGSTVNPNFYGEQGQRIFVRKADLEQAYTEWHLRPEVGRTLANPPDTTSSATIDPYKVDWWDVKGVGDIIDEAIKALPGDYVEQFAWNYPHSFVDQKVLVAYPRLGRRRDDLRFVQGENIVSSPGLESSDSYASAVIGIGAGEGSAALRETAEVITPGRIRKTYVYRNSKITDRTTLARIVREELNERSAGGYRITSVIVRASHENARFGAYNVGDDVLVQVQVPHFGWVAQWGRITSMTLARGEDLVELHLKRSDAFRYGREVESS